MNAYSEDLRKKIVEALRRGMGKSQAARTFSVSLSSVKRYAKTAEEGRSLAPMLREFSVVRIHGVLRSPASERVRRALACGTLGTGRRPAKSQEVPR
jgi:transposase-like protein